MSQTTALVYNMFTTKYVTGGVRTMMPAQTGAAVFCHSYSNVPWTEFSKTSPMKIWAWPRLHWPHGLNSHGSQNGSTYTRRHTRIISQGAQY